jgi:hypothetical protein
MQKSIGYLDRYSYMRVAHANLLVFLYADIHFLNVKCIATW